MVKNAILNILGSAWPTLVIFLVIIIMLRIFYLKQNKKKKVCFTSRTCTIIVCNIYFTSV